MNNRRESGWFDWRMTWSVVLSAVLAAGSTAYAVNSGWYGVIQDIDRLKNGKLVMDDRMSRMERTVEQNRLDVKEQLNAIGSDIKDTRKDVREISLMLARQPQERLNRWEK